MSPCVCSAKQSCVPCSRADTWEGAAQHYRCMGTCTKHLYIMGQKGNELISLQMQVCISLCFSFFTCTKEKLILSTLAKGFETCRLYRFAMVILVIPNSLAQS